MKSGGRRRDGGGRIEEQRWKKEKQGEMKRGWTEEEIEGRQSWEQRQKPRKR